MNARELALFIVLLALSLAIQIVIPRPPNVEFTSFFAFAVGLIEGAAAGAFFGSLVMFVNGFLSPVGFGGLNIPFQIAGMIIAGILGGVYRRFVRNVNHSQTFFSETAILGAFIAMIYDLVTNLGYCLSLVFLGGESWNVAVLTAIANGAFLSLVHIVSNSIVFGILFLPLMNALSSLKVDGLPWSKKEHLYS